MSSGRCIPMALALGLLVACESRPAEEDPQPESVPAPEAAEGADTTSAPVDTVSESPREARVEEAIDRLVQIGVLDGAEEQVFGRIRDVVVDDAARVYVLDDQTLRLSWFDRHGTFRGAAGRPGGGPGEFRAPTALAVDRTGRVQVLDVAHRRVSTFAASDTAINLVDEFAVPFFGTDFCRVEGRYFFLSAQDNGVIHEVAADGSVVRSFGEIRVEVPDELNTPQNVQMLRDNAARGRLVCASDPPVLVFVPEMQAVVQAFSPDGRLLWSVPMEDYRQRGWELSPRGGVRMAADPETGSAHTAKDAALMGTDRIGITLHEGSLANPEGSLELRIMSLEDGSELERRTATGMLAIVRDGLTYSYVNSPFPQITITPVATRR